MKKLIIISILAACIATFGCDKLDDKYSSVSTRVYTIASMKPTIQYSPEESTYGGQPIYIYKGSEDTYWQLWMSADRIDGLDELYEEGYEYIINVKCYKLVEPMMDAGAYEYRLANIIKKTEKTSEGVPAKFIE